jgi:hypothetical protein
MKTRVALIVAALLVAGSALRAEERPRGDLFELHSCQLYIGGCIASSESTLEGKYMLRVWSITGGSHEGVLLKGLQVALLETSDQNLAFKGIAPSESVIYLPSTASPAQAVALIDWIKSSDPELSRGSIRTRVVPMTLNQSKSSVCFAAGSFLQFKATPFEPCGLTSCGESLWYTPRFAVSRYTVGVSDRLIVREPMLTLTWIDHGKSNVFEGNFGGSQTAQAVFEPITHVCAVPGRAHYE